MALAALFAKEVLGRFLVSYDVPEPNQASFQRRLARLKRIYDISVVLQSVLETVGIAAAEAVYNLALACGGKAAIYIVAESKLSEGWAERPSLRRSIGFFNDEPPLIEMERNRREPRLPLGFQV